MSIPQEPLPARVRNIAELARIAGVSAGTVSRALAGSNLVNDSTRERIQALAKKFDFRPNQMARRLRTQRSGAIGVAIPLGHDQRQHISDPFFMAMLGNLADALTENGYDLVLSRVIPHDSAWLDQIVDSGMLEGLILIGQSNQIEAIERVAKRYLPLVVWGSFTPGQTHCSVGTDNFLGGKLAAEHLIAHGAKSIAFLGDPEPLEIGQRLAGCTAAVKKAGLADSVQIIETPLARDVLEVELAKRFEAMGNPVDGIVCASDVIAMAALSALADRGIAVPQTTRIIGYDDLQLSQHTVPRLSTIRQDITRGARHLIEALFARINGEETASVVMPPTLVVRRST